MNKFNEFYKKYGLQSGSNKTTYNPNNYGYELRSSFPKKDDVVYSDNTTTKDKK